LNSNEGIRVLRGLGFTAAGGAVANYSTVYFHQTSNPWLLLIIGVLVIVAAWVTEGREIKREKQEHINRRLHVYTSQVR